MCGDRRRLPPDVDQAAYRVVQEALTNVSRHAGKATASVQITYDARTLTKYAANVYSPLPSRYRPGVGGG